MFQTVNGVSSALVEGVDRFDLMYLVQDAAGTFQYLDATGVENLATASCFQAPLGASAVIGDLENRPGCGWRSVVSVDVHLLLNTVYDSSVNEQDPFNYSLEGNTQETPADLNSGIETYKMIRKEFMTSVTIKNNNN